MNKCKCGGELCINAGDRIIDGTFRWYASYHCNNCRLNTEMDGNGIDSIPDDIKEIIIRRDGRWELTSSPGNLKKIKYILKKILKNYDSLILPGDVIYYGTQNQVRWVKNRLVEKGINEDGLDVRVRGLGVRFP